MAKNPVKIHVDASRLNGALHELSRLTGKDFKTVVRHETGKIMQMALSRTPAAKAKDIKAGVENWEFITASADLYAPKTPRDAGRYQGFVPQKGGKGIPRVVYYKGNRYPQALWSQLMQIKERKIQRLLMARGLLKKSWIQVCHRMGVEIGNTPAYVAGATTPKGDYPEDARGGERGEGSKFSFWGEIDRIYDQRIIRALSSAMRGRVNYFKTNLRKGVFLKGKEIARRYPGLYVNGN